MARSRFLTLLAYRENFWTGIAVYVVYIGAYHFLWQAVYAGRESLGGLTPAQMTSYLAVAWMARAFYFNHLDREMAAEVREGRVAVELTRPYDYVAAKLAAALGEGVFRLVFFALPGMALVCLLFPVRLPPPAAWPAFALVLFLAFWVNALVNVLTGLAAFFVLNNSGLMHARRVLVDLFSGLYLPLSFYPPWALAALRLLPFQAIAYLPGLAFVGGLQGRALGAAVAVQAAWIALLALAVAGLWRLAQRRLVVQGG